MQWNAQVATSGQISFLPAQLLVQIACKHTQALLEKKTDAPPNLMHTVDLKPDPFGHFHAKCDKISLHQYYQYRLEIALADAVRSASRLQPRSTITDIQVPSRVSKLYESQEDSQRHHRTT